MPQVGPPRAPPVFLFVLDLCVIEEELDYLKGALRRVLIVETPLCSKVARHATRPKNRSSPVGSGWSPVACRVFQCAGHLGTVGLQLHDQGLPTWVCLLLGRVCCRRSAFCRRDPTGGAHHVRTRVHVHELRPGVPGYTCSEGTRR